jgi:hypothetical protein
MQPVSKINDSILYLLHATNKDYTKFNQLEPSTTSIFNKQFPGVYFSLITKENIDTELLSMGDNLLLFSVELLKQRNYHINIQDMNGIITQYNTYFYWELDEAVHHISIDVKNKKENMENINFKKKTINEVVFHDPIDMKYLCKVIDRSKYIYSIKNILPSEQLKNDIKPNIKLIPFYCYYNENQYTGIFPPPRSSNEWLNMMNNVSKNIICKNEDYKEKYYKRIAYLYENREKQNLNYLYNWKRILYYK